MPFKRNPISAEKINSLAREVAAYAQIAWQNYSLSILERTLDDSANRRTILPEAFIKCEDIILTMTKMLQGLRINPSAVSRNINRYGQFAGLERLLLVLTQRGADRQKMHEILRRISMTAWAEVELGETNPLFEMIVQREEIKKILDRDQITKAMDVSGYTGIAVKRALECAVMIEKTIE